MKFYFVFISFFICSTSQAAITNFAVSGNYSNYVKTTTGTGSTATSTHSVYGGVGSFSTPALCSGTSTCNTCTDATYASANLANTGCNPKAIGTATTVSISFTVGTAGTAKMVTSANNQVGAASVVVTANQTVTLTYTWSEICAAIGDSACLTEGNVTLYAGVSTGGTTLAESQQITFFLAAIQDTADTTYGGLSDFTMFPGDQKAYVKTAESFTSLTTPTGSSVGMKSLILYFAESNCGTGAEAATITNAGDYRELALDSSGLTSNKVTGLTNGTSYLFKAAMQDLAGNIGLFTTAPSSAGGANSCAQFYQTVIPQTVYGLLNDGDNCFIATAAFGSIMDSRVQVFRDFRDEFLLKTNLGKKFVKFYYKHSPALADFIAESPTLRAISRAILYPFLGAAWLYLNVGVIPANIILTFGLVGLFMFISRLRPRNR